MLSACENSHTKISEGIWSRFEGDAYLKAHMVSILILDNQYLTSDKEHNPNKYMQHPLPKVWFSPTGVDLFVDASVHLLFLGIMKDVHRITM